LEEYNSIKETEYIMKSPAMMDIIRKGDDEIKNGGGTSVDIENLWK
jgi:antitoxin YefM